MKTVILIREQENDAYNDDAVMDQILNGQKAMWRFWYSGDGRYVPTKAQVGDRFFIYQKRVGIIASGTIAHTNHSTPELRKAGMVCLTLMPDKCGKPILPGRQVNRILSRSHKTQSGDELVLDYKSDALAIEELWMKSILENNSSPEPVSDDFWSGNCLNEQALEALRQRILNTTHVCPCCGALLKANDQILYRPAITNIAYHPVKSYDDLPTQYAILCKECASTEKLMKQTR